MLSPQRVIAGPMSPPWWHASLAQLLPLLQDKIDPLSSQELGTRTVKVMSNEFT